jgi:hypothetical protein
MQEFLFSDYRSDLLVMKNRLTTALGSIQKEWRLDPTSHSKPYAVFVPSRVFA